MDLKSKYPESMPPQHQERQPGIEKEMRPRPVYDTDEPGYGRLAGKVEPLLQAVIAG